MTLASEKRPQSLPQAPCRRRRLVVAAGVALVLLLAAGWSWYVWLRPTPPPPPDVSLDGADPAVREAVEAARERVHREPRSAAAWGFLGKVLRAHGYDPQADVCFRQAEKLDPEELRWPYLQGVQLLLHDPEAALPYLERTVALCDRHQRRDSAPRLRLAEALTQLGRFEEAEKHYQHLLSGQPDNPLALCGLGVCAAGRNDRAASIEYLSRATDSPLTRKRALALLAAVHLRAHDDKAAAEFSRAAAQAPPDQLWNDPYVSETMDLEVGRQREFKKVERLEGQGRIEEAFHLLSELSHDAPDDRSFVALGIFLSKTGQFERAEAALRKSVAVEPDKVQGHYYLCLVLFTRAERLWKEHPEQRAQALDLFRQAESSGRRAVELKPDHGFAHVYRGLALQYLGRRTEAIASLRRGVSCRPEIADPHLHLGEVLAQAGQKEEAIKELKIAVELAPEKDPRPRAALARVRGDSKPPE